MEQYFTVQEVANMLQVTKRTIWEWIRKDKLVAVCLSNHNYRITESDLKAFTNGKKTKVKK